MDGFPIIDAPGLRAKERWEKKQQQSRRGERDPRAGRDTSRGGGQELVCARCAQHVTTSDARIEVHGLHEHSQINPHGFIWHFGCFQVAPGCRPAGAPTAEFTWFAGYTWQIENCAGCDLHLGWRFSAGDSHFHGLILERLLERNHDGR